jgi:hypothetical protein
MPTLSSYVDGIRFAVDGGRAFLPVRTPWLLSGGRRHKISTGMVTLYFFSSASIAS